jgi:hypothetical protein
MVTVYVPVLIVDGGSVTYEVDVTDVEMVSVTAGAATVDVTLIGGDAVLVITGTSGPLLSSLAYRRAYCLARCLYLASFKTLGWNRLGV